jgi:hypothetical protein
MFNLVEYYFWKEDFPPYRILAICKLFFNYGCDLNTVGEKKKEIIAQCYLNTYEEQRATTLLK